MKNSYLLNIFYLIAIYLLVDFQALKAQTETYRFKKIGIDDGLSQNAIMDIVQDHEGFLWIATGDGLNKYNGYEINVYRNNFEDPTSISSNDLDNLFCDSKGRLWIVSETGGLNLYRSKTDDFISFFNKEVFPGNTTISTNIVEDKKGYFWFAINRIGLVKFNPDDYSYQVISGTDDTLKNLVFTYVEIIDDLLWIGTRNKGLLFFDKKKNAFITENIPNTENLDPQVRIIKHNKGEVFIGTMNGIYYYEKDKNAINYLKINGFDPRISEINTLLISDSTLWFNSQDRGLLKYSLSDSTLNIFKPSRDLTFSISYPAVTSIYQDHNKTLWVGTYGGGLNKTLRSNAFELYSHDSEDDFSLPHASSREILKDEQGRLIVASYGGVKIFENKKKKAFQLPFNNNPQDLSLKNDSSLLSNSTYSLALDHDQNLWIGHEGSGIQYFNLETKRFKNYNLKSLDYTYRHRVNFVRSIEVDKHNNVWIGALDGAFFKPAKADTFISIFMDNIFERKVSDILILDEQYIIIASEYGNYIGNIDSAHYSWELNLKKINFSEYKLYNKTKSIHAFNDSTLLFATAGSGIWVVRYNIIDNQFIVTDSYPVNNETIKKQMVYGILNESDSVIWFSSNNGLYEYHFYEDRLYNYNKSDGLQNNEFNTASYYKDKNGKMYFGGINGINAFNPENIKQIPKEFNIHFKTLMFGDSTISNLQYNNLADIKIPQDKNQISVEYFAINLESDKSIKYYVQLIGLDKKPIEMGGQRVVNYFNLSPGEYELRIWAFNYNNPDFSSHYSALDFTIVPAFYNTNVFKALLLILIIAVSLALFRARTKNLRNQKEKLEKEVQLSQKEIENQKLENEIITSKAVIRGQIIEQKRISEELHDGIGHLLTAASLNISAIQQYVQKGLWDKLPDEIDYIKNIINQAVSEVRNVSHNLMPNLLVQEGLESAIREFTSRIHRNSDVKISLDCSEFNNNISSETAVSIFRMIQEAVNNSLKHADATKIHIELKEENNHILIRIKDNGKGFNQSTIKNSTGLGLKNLQARAELNKGDFNISSQKGKGTEINISIPVNLSDDIQS